MLLGETGLATELLRSLRNLAETYVLLPPHDHLGQLLHCGSLSRKHLLQIGPALVEIVRVRAETQVIVDLASFEASDMFHLWHGLDVDFTL